MIFLVPRLLVFTMGRYSDSDIAGILAVPWFHQTMSWRSINLWIFIFSQNKLCNIMMIFKMNCRTLTYSTNLKVFSINTEIGALLFASLCSLFFISRWTIVEALNRSVFFALLKFFKRNFKFWSNFSFIGKFQR